MFKKIKEEIKLIKEKDQSIHSDMKALLHPSFKIKMYGYAGYKICIYYNMAQKQLILNKNKTM